VKSEKAIKGVREEKKEGWITRLVTSCVRTAF